MSLKFRLENGEIFEETPFGSGRVSYLVFLQEILRTHLFVKKRL